MLLLSPLPPFAVFAASDFHIGGNIAAVTDTARKYHAFGEAALVASARMASLHDGGFEGSEGDQYRELLNADFPRHLEITGSSHTGMGVAIDHYAAGLSAATVEMDTLRPVAAGHHTAVQVAVGEYNVAAANAARAATTASVATGTAIATAAVPGLNATTAAAAASAQAEAQAAELARQAALAKYEAAKAVWEADRTTASGIKDTLRMVTRSAVGEVAALARATFDENPNWLEQAWDKIDKFFDENAEALKIISDVLQIVGTIMMFIPGLQVVGVVLLAVGVGLKGALAATGNCSWGEFFFDLATCGMGGALFKAAKAGKMGYGLFKGSNALSKTASSVKGAVKTAAGKSAAVLTRGKQICAAAEPVDMATGNMVDFKTDVVIPGVLPLVVDRNSNSAYELGRALGPRWVSRMDTRLEICRDEVLFVSPDGAVLSFPPAPLDGGEVCSDGHGWYLSFGDGSYYVRNIKEGLTYRFDIAGENSAVSGAVVDASPAQGQNPAGSGVPAGSLAEVMGVGIEIGVSALTHHTGHRIDYLYDQSSGRMTSMVRSDGTTLTIVWDEFINRVASLWVSNPTTHPGDEPVRLISYEYDGHGQLIRVINSHAGVLRYAYDDQGRAHRWTDRNGVSYQYTFDDAGRVQAQVGTGGMFPNIMYWGPDTGTDAPVGGRVCVLIETATEFTDDPLQVGDAVIDTYLERLKNLPLYTMLVEGGLQHAGVTGRGRTEPREDEGFIKDWALDPGLLVDEVLGQLRVTVYRSTPAGDVWRIVSPEGAAVDTLYNDTHQPVATVSAAGARTVYEYNTDGLLVGCFFADGTSQYVEAGSWGVPVKVVGRDGGITEFEVDGCGLTTAVTDPAGATTWFEYELRTTGVVLSKVTNPVGAVTVVECDDAGREIAVTDSYGRRTSRVLDVRGLVTESMDEVGNATLVEYTPEGWPTRIIHPDGSMVTALYDGEGNRVSVTNEVGATTTTRYTVFDKPISVTDPSGATTTLRYNTQLEPVGVTNADGNTWVYRYNHDGVVVEEVDYNGITTTSQSSVDGLVTSITTPAGTVTTTRSVVGLVDTVTDPLGVTSYEYDQLGRVTSISSPSGVVVGFDRDEFGRVLAEHVTLASGERMTSAVELDATGVVAARELDLPVVGRVRTDFQRDDLGLVTGLDVTRAGIPPVSGAHGLEGTHTVAGVAPTPGVTTTPGVDAAMGAGVPVVSMVFGVGERGERSHVTVGSLHRRFGYDCRGRVISDTTSVLDAGVVGGLVPVAGRGFAWRADSALVGIDDLLRGTTRFELDVLGRAVGVTTTPLVSGQAHPVLGGFPTAASDGALGGVLGATGTPVAGPTAGGVVSESYGFSPAGVLASINAPAETTSSSSGTIYGHSDGSAYGDSTTSGYGRGGASAGGQPGVGVRDGRVEFVGTRPVRVGRTTYTYDAAGRVVRTSTKRVSRKPLVHHFYYGAGEQPVGFMSSDAPGVGYRYVYDGLGRRVAKEAIDTASGVVVSRVVFAHAGDQLVAQVTTLNNNTGTSVASAVTGVATAATTATNSTSAVAGGVSGVGEGFVWITDPATGVLMGQVNLTTKGQNTTTRNEHNPTWDGHSTTGNVNNPAWDGYPTAGNGHPVVGGGAPGGEGRDSGGRDVPVKEWSQERVDAEFFALVTDLAGAPREIIDPSSGVVVGFSRQSLYGRRSWLGDVSSPLLFAGQYVDAESGWAYNRFRYYDPHAGVYNAQDPLGLAPRIASAQGYVDHAAYWVDELGLASHSPGPFSDGKLSTVKGAVGERAAAIWLEEEKLTNKGRRYFTANGRDRISDGDLPEVKKLMEAKFVKYQTCDRQILDGIDGAKQAYGEDGRLQLVVAPHTRVAKTVYSHPDIDVHRLAEDHVAQAKREILGSDDFPL